MSYTRKAFFGIGSVLVMYAIGLIFAFLFRILLARNLSVAEYGLYYALFSFFAVIFILRDLGTQSALIKFLPEWLVKKSYSEIKRAFIITLAYSVVVSFVIIGLCVLFSGFIAERFFKLPGIEGVIILYAVAFALSTLDGLITTVYISFQRINLYSAIGVVRPALLLLFTFVLFRYFPGVKAPILGLLLSHAAIVMIWLPFSFKLIPWASAVKWNFAPVKKFFLFGAQIFIASLGGALLQYTDSLMLTYFKSVSDVGIYNAAIPISNLLLYLSSAISTVTLPMFSELLARRMHSHVKEALNLLYKYTVVVALPAAAVLFTFPDLIIRVIFGPEYEQASIALKILVFGALFSTVAQINFTYFSASGKPLLVTKLFAIAAIVNVVLNFILIPPYGIVGAAVATSLSLGVMLIINKAILHRYLKIESPVWSWTKNLVCCIIMIGIIIGLKKILVMQIFLEAFIVLLIAGMAYIGLIFLFGIVDVKELKELKSHIFP